MFSLDDVRDSFTNDMQRFLAEIEKGSRAIASACALAPGDRMWQPPVNSMIVGLHGMAGSSSLVGVDTIASTSRRLEAIATMATESVDALRVQLDRLRKIASACLEGSSDLRVILEHELAGRTTEAGIRRGVLDNKIDLAMKGISEIVDRAKLEVADDHDTPARTAPQSVPIPAPPRTPSPPTPVSSPPATDEGWGIDDELLQVFQAEAREALTSLRGYLARLAQHNTDREAATHCARLLHLLKGAAASVGLEENSARARDLHTEVERLRAAGFDRESLAKLTERVEDYIAFSIPDLAATTGTTVTANAVDDDEPLAIFREEALTSIEEARALLQKVRQTAGTARGVLTSRLERILHRLKGSALIVGEAQTAAIASRGQTLCEALERVDPEALASVLDQLGTMVKAKPEPVAAKGPSLIRIALPPQGEWDVYVEESSGLLEELDQTLSRIESSNRPTADLSNLFRSYHTLKGATNAVGLSPIGQHLHLVETFLEKLVATSNVDDLRGIVRALTEQNESIRRNIARAGSDGEVSIDHESVQQRLSQVGSKVTGESWIQPNDSAWSATGSIGDSDSEASASHAASAGPAEPEPEEQASDRRFVRVPADRLDNLLDLAGELVVCRSRMLSRVGKIQRLQDDDVSRHEAVTDLIDSFAQSTQFTNLDGRARRGMQRLSDGSVASSGSSFGSLELDQYEEIHVLSRRLDEAASDIDEVRRDMGTEMQLLTEDADMLSTIATGLQSEITRARMLMVDTLFTRLRLPVRDAAHRTNREVEIVTAGEQLAIDKSMSDALYGPLLHIVRNAVVHGVEPPDRRAMLGKPRAGRITMVAKQEHGEIVLELTDDGAGIDLEKLRAIGIAKRLIPAGIELDDPRVIDLIFAKGISTHDGAGDVAGRGLGGNVVKRTVDRMNGSISVTTKRGIGTTFRITLPLSMSITQAVLVRVDRALLAIPIAYAETIVSRQDVEVVDSFGRLRARMGDRMIPIHQMHKVFDVKTDEASSHNVLVVCIVGGERVAIEVDEIISQEEIVVKSLGALLDGHPLFSGSTSRGDGELALIIDVPGVLEAESSGRDAGRVPRPAPHEAPQFELPDAEPESIESSASAAPPEDVAPPVGRQIEVAEIVPLPVGRLRVLFADDSLSVRKVAERMLASLDVDVVTAIDGQDALEKLRAMQFSLVFTDLEMPRMHGFELIREMQILPAYKAIPVVVISSRSGQKHIDQALSMGAKEYLTKPFSPEILGGVLDRLARRPR